MMVGNIILRGWWDLGKEQGQASVGITQLLCICDTFPG